MAKSTLRRPTPSQKSRPHSEAPKRVATSARTWVYAFGDGKADGSAGMRDLLGGKGANLAEMANLGLPVPPGFTITTEICSYFYAHSRQYPDDLAAQTESALALVGEATGRFFGEASNPLLV